MTTCDYGEPPAAQRWSFGAKGQIQQGDDTCLLASDPPALGSCKGGGNASLITGIAYVIVASVTVLVPMGIYVLMRSKADELLANLGEWMKSNSDAITIVVLVIFGVKLLLGGLAGLT